MQIISQIQKNPKKKKSEMNYIYTRRYSPLRFQVPAAAAAPWPTCPDACSWGPFHKCPQHWVGRAPRPPAFPEPPRTHQGSRRGSASWWKQSNILVTSLYIWEDLAAMVISTKIWEFLSFFMSTLWIIQQHLKSFNDFILTYRSRQVILCNMAVLALSYLPPSIPVAV